MGRSAQEKPKKLRATKAGLPLMSFAKRRNLRLALKSGGVRCRGGQAQPLTRKLHPPFKPKNFSQRNSEVVPEVTERNPDILSRKNFPHATVINPRSAHTLYPPSCAVSALGVLGEMDRR